MCQVHGWSAPKQHALDVLAVSLQKAEAVPCSSHSPQQNTLVLRQLKDPNAEIRWRAAWSIGQMGHAGAAFSGALARLLQDSDAFVRWCAAEAIYELGKGVALHAEELARRLDDPDAFVRSSATEGFPRLGRAATPHAAAIERRLVDEEPFVRVSAAAAFGRAGKVAMPHAATLAQRVLEDESIHVRRRAVWALGRVCAGPALRDISCAFQALATASLEDPDAIVRRFAAVALAPPRNAMPSAQPNILREVLGGQGSAHDKPQDIAGRISFSTPGASGEAYSENSAVWALRQIVVTVGPHADALSKKFEESTLAVNDAYAVAREHHCVCPKEICGNIFGAKQTEADSPSKVPRSRTRRFTSAGRQINEDAIVGKANHGSSVSWAAASSSDS